MRPTIEVYADATGKYRWRIVAVNGQITAASAEAFDSKGNEPMINEGPPI